MYSAFQLLVLMVGLIAKMSSDKIVSSCRLVFCLFLWFLTIIIDPLLLNPFMSEITKYEMASVQWLFFC